MLLRHKIMRKIATSVTASSIMAMERKLGLPVQGEPEGQAGIRNVNKVNKIPATTIPRKRLTKASLWGLLSDGMVGNSQTVENIAGVADRVVPAPRDLVLPVARSGFSPPVAVAVNPASCPMPAATAGPTVQRAVLAGRPVSFSSPPLAPRAQCPAQYPRRRYRGCASSPPVSR